MKKLALTILGALAIVGSGIAQNRSVEFQEGSFTEGVAKAKAANKLIFMDAYTTWCGPCKYMASKIFTQDKVADFFNTNFVNLKFDMEKGEGIELAKRFSVKAYPTFLVLDTAGNVVHRIVGSAEADEFIEKAKAALSPKTSLLGQKNEYDKGNREPEFVKSYLNTLKTAYMEEDAKQVATAYLRSIKESDRVKKENWPIYNDFINDPSSKEFMFILTNRIKFTDAIGDSAISAKIDAVFTEKAMTLLVNRKSAAYTKEEASKLRKLISASKPDNVEKFWAILNLADSKFAKNGAAIAAYVNGPLKNVKLTDEEAYDILYQIIPVVSDFSTKDDVMIVAAYIDARMASMKDEKVKEYFTKLKAKLTSKLSEQK
jgi:thiol-disulfide isomerase/thioredoxin